METKLNLQINLNEKEIALVKLLKSIIKEKNLQLTLRIAGGWVRDKILGKDSDDIDIALDNMSGEEFLKTSYDFLKEHADVSGFGVTKLNPTKSKHLETAKIKINNQWIDFVHLRSESYNENSRIPKIKIGTPYEDAMRRDLTINSLFYNIMTDEIEDFTQQGISDLQNSIARTPLQPEETFLDDPLRILRLYRFAARFNLNILPHILEAANQQKILEALQTKVSRERISIELVHVIRSDNPIQALNLYYQNQLFPIIFQVPANSDLYNLPDPENIIKKILDQSYQACIYVHTN